MGTSVRGLLSQATTAANSRIKPRTIIACGVQDHDPVRIPSERAGSANGVAAVGNAHVAEGDCPHVAAIGCEQVGLDFVLPLGKLEAAEEHAARERRDRKSTRLNSSH